MGSPPSIERRSGDGDFLPDFCSPRAVLAIVLVAELFAILLSLARHHPGEPFWMDLARISLFLLWCTLLSAGLLCPSRRLLSGRRPAITSLAALGLVLVSVCAVSLGAWWTGLLWRDAPGLFAVAPTLQLGEFLLTNLMIAAIVTGLLLRYYWVTAQWRRQVEAEAHSRIRALQARIRPHFLFNSMNTIAALTRIDPRRAEEAVEDLADLFRASLSDASSTMTLKQELELTRTYQRIETHRLGDRLEVDWNIRGIPLRARVPALSIQPLMENAIYHGIERLPAGGRIEVLGCFDPSSGEIELCIENPVPPEGPAGSHAGGNRIALDNLRQRFRLLWGERASIEVATTRDSHRVCLRFPAEETP